MTQQNNAIKILADYEVNEILTSANIKVTHDKGIQTDVVENKTGQELLLSQGNKEKTGNKQHLDIKMSKKYTGIQKREINTWSVKQNRYHNPVGWLG